MKSTFARYKQAVLFMFFLWAFILISAATVTAGFYLWLTWGDVSHFLKSWGIPYWVIFCTKVIFFVLVFSVPFNAMLFLTSLPIRRFNIIITDSEDTADTTIEDEQPLAIDGLTERLNKLYREWMKSESWVENNATIHSLRFEQAVDFCNDTPMGMYEFSRLYFSKEHQCRAELHQMFTLPDKPIVTLTCVFVSVLVDSRQNQWILETSNAPTDPGAGITWAKRRPRELWSRHFGWDATQVLKFHLERRDQMIRDLCLSPATDLTWEGYQRDKLREASADRKRSVFKLGLITCYENYFCKNKTEWWGDFRKYMNANNTSVTNVT